MAYGNVPIDENGALICDANTARTSLIIVNVSSSVIVYIGPDSSVDTSTGIPLYENQSQAFVKGMADHWKGPIYGITATGQTANIRYWEIV